MIWSELDVCCCVHEGCRRFLSYIIAILCLVFLGYHTLLILDGYETPVSESAHCRTADVILLLSLFLVTVSNIQFCTRFVIARGGICGGINRHSVVFCTLRYVYNMCAEHNILSLSGVVALQCLPLDGDFHIRSLIRHSSPERWAARTY